MSFLRRLFGGDAGRSRDAGRGGDYGPDGDGGQGEDGGPDGVGGRVRPSGGSSAEPNPGLSLDEVEQRLERENLRQEAERLDELQQRQLRYADRAWTPPAQGGERRADDAEAGSGEG
jgi:hypothetical protein